MQIGDGQRVNKVATAGKGVVCLAGKTGNHIETERCVGQLAANTLQQGGKEGRVVGPAHALQDKIVAGLQRNMQVRADD